MTARSPEEGGGRGKGFDLGALLAERGAERYELHARHLNHQLPRMLHTIGFDKVYERAEGAHFWDAEGNDYLDMLAGFGVMGLGRHHPVVRRALHDVLDAQLADLTRFDCPPLPGLLAEKLLSYSPHLDRVFFGNSGTEAVETALKFARYATGRPRILYCDHAFHGLTTGSLSVNGEGGFRDGFAPLLPDTRIALGDLAALERELKRGDVAAFVVEPIQGKGCWPPHPVSCSPRRRCCTGGGAADRGRGADRPRADRGLLRLPARAGGGAGPGVRGESAVGRLRAGRRHPGQGLDLQEGLLVHGPGPRALRELRLQRPGDGGGPGGAVRHGGRGGRRQRPGHGRPAAGRLAALVDEYELLHEVRGRGLMIGIEFGRPSSLGLRSRWTMLQAARKGLFAQMVVVPLLQKHRILTQVSGDHLEVIKLIPPLIVDERDVDRFVDAFREVMDEAHGGSGLIWDFGRTLVKQAVAAR